MVQHYRIDQEQHNLEAVLQVSGSCNCIRFRLHFASVNNWSKLHPCLRLCMCSHVCAYTHTRFKVLASSGQLHEAFRRLVASCTVENFGFTRMRL